jgi:LssY C-terminus
MAGNETVFRRRIGVKAGLAAALLMLISACASAPPFQPPSADYQAALRERAVTKVEDNIRVSAAIPTEEESRSIFGIDLKDHDIMPIWLEIENRGNQRFILLPTGLDPEYFAPLEVAFLYNDDFADRTPLGAHLQALNFDSRSPIAPGATASGFVLVNAVETSMIAQIDLFGWRWSKRIPLFVPVPGYENAQRRIAELGELYAWDKLVEVGDEARLRAALEELPCCTTDKTGAGRGLPLNLVVIGGLEEAGPAFVRRGFRYSPVSPLHALGRPQDLSVRKQARWVAAQPHTLRFWMTPLRYDGRPIWIGQASTTLGGRFAGAADETASIDPDVDDSRNDVVQDLLYSQSVARLGFVKGMERVGAASPRTMPNGSTYHTDGLRAVMVFKAETVSLSEVDLFEWRVFSPAVADRPTHAPR